MLDTSAFFAGFDPFSISEDQATVPKVKEEIRSNSMSWVRFEAAVENGKLKVKAPSEEYLNKVKVSANKVGDSFFLSETDMQLLALALEFKAAGYTTQIVTDDYSIQNVATQLGIEFAPLATFGIRRLLEWVRYCPACRREYTAEYASTKCEVCGTVLKRKPRKISKNNETT
ncbi:MAG: NOB1 family endonuclease [Candidatus Bathyarchaeales archaeon]